MSSHSRSPWIVEPGSGTVGSGARAHVISPGRLYMLAMPYPLDGRASTHPPGADGVSAKNCYLVVEGDDALLIDTGYPIYADALMAWLDELVRPGMTLSVMPFAFQESQCVANVAEVVQRHPLQRYIAAVDSAAVSVSVRMERLGTPGVAALDRMPVTLLSAAEAIDVDRAGARRLEIVRAKLKLFNVMVWFYDEQTRTLFTGDVFSHVTQDGADGPWVVSRTDSTAESVLGYLLQTRYWWLQGAETHELIADLDAIFDVRDVEVIAPMWGCVLRGHDLVARERSALTEAIETAGAMSGGYHA